MSEFMSKCFSSQDKPGERETNATFLRTKFCTLYVEHTYVGLRVDEDVNIVVEISLTYQTLT